VSSPRRRLSSEALELGAVRTHVPPSLQKPVKSSPSPIPVPTRSGLEERAGERRPFAVLWPDASWKGLFRFCACIGTMNLKPRIPKGFRNKAQGCEGGKSSLDRATLGLRRRTSTTLKGLRPLRAARRFVGSFNVRRTCIATMNRRGLLPLLHRGRGGYLEFGYWSFFGIWSFGFGASPDRFMETDRERGVRSIQDFVDCRSLSSPTAKIITTPIMISCI
jgi:hypothetical protein